MIYKVRASKTGCHAPGNTAQAFVDTAVMEIPPPVTNLDIRLTCPAPVIPDPGGQGPGPGSLTRPCWIRSRRRAPIPLAPVVPTAKPLVVGLSLPRTAGKVTLGKTGTFSLTTARASCPAAATAACTLSVAASLPKSKTRKKAVPLGSLKSTLAPGRSAALRGKLSRRGLTLVKRLRSVTTTVSVSATVPGGAAVTQGLKATLKRPKR